MVKSSDKLSIKISVVLGQNVDFQQGSKIDLPWQPLNQFYRVGYPRWDLYITAIDAGKHSFGFLLVIWYKLSWLFHLKTKTVFGISLMTSVKFWPRLFCLLCKESTLGATCANVHHVTNSPSPSAPLFCHNISVIYSLNWSILILSKVMLSKTKIAEKISV